MEITPHFVIFQSVCIYTPIAKFFSCVSPSHWCPFMSLTPVFIPVHVSHRRFVDIHQSHLVYSAIIVSPFFFSCSSTSQHKRTTRKMTRTTTRTKMRTMTRMMTRITTRASRLEAMAVRLQLLFQQQCDGKGGSGATARWQQQWRD